MILEHHKLSRYRGDPAGSSSRSGAPTGSTSRWGSCRFGVSRRVLASIVAAWPSAGFHRRLVQLERSGCGRTRWHPLPMVKL